MRYGKMTVNDESKRRNYEAFTAVMIQGLLGFKAV
jgi:hypothetical protein